MLWYLLQYNGLHVTKRLRYYCQSSQSTEAYITNWKGQNTSNSLLKLAACLPDTCMWMS